MHCYWEYKLVQPLWKPEWRFLKKLKIQLPYDPAIALWNTLSKGDEISILKRYLHSHSHFLYYGEENSHKGDSWAVGGMVCCFCVWCSA